MSFEIPIMFCVFNRPEVTRRVFESIRQQRPRRLFLVSDGPRSGVATDPVRIQQTRAIVDAIDWPCDVQTNYASENLGCKRRMSSGISWAFESVDELIVLEDDCLPHDSFYPYCEQLLERYRDQENVMLVSGDNFQPHRRTSDSYFFSRYAHIWGWATWKRAWKHFDGELKGWAPGMPNGLSFDSDSEAEFWINIFDHCAAGKIDSWAFPWQYSTWKNDGLTILPEVNLISNIGFGEEATHTVSGESPLANLPTYDIGQLSHPRLVERHVEADRWTAENLFAPPVRQPVIRKPSWWRRLLRAA